MKQKISCKNHRNEETGEELGGTVRGTGLRIDWQKGPVLFECEEGGDPEPQFNGATIESVIEAAINRLQHHQTGEYACEENGDAIEALQSALGDLESREARIATETGIPDKEATSAE